MSTKDSTPKYSKGQLYQINVKDLHSDQNQPRKHFDPVELENLANSIAKHGVLQPILFRQDEEGQLFVAAGERRLQATIKTGLETIPSIMVEGNIDEIALVENLLRSDLTAIETSESCHRIMVEHNYTQEDLGAIIGKAKSTVSEIISLMNLPKEIRDKCRGDKSISRQSLINIAKKKKEDRMLAAFNKYKERIASGKKPGAPKGGKRKSLPERFASKYCNLDTLLTDMELKKIKNEDRTDLISRIEELKKMADDLIDQIKAAPAPETKTVATPTPKTVKEKKQPKVAPVAKKVVTRKKGDVRSKTKTKK